ncbi:hypothetical protein MUTS10_19180 [Escherichia coli]|nr:hypothetical protein MUTS9_49340 [Escherichia coli]BDY78586.1 hypothetical protein MUTS10_19180 [Escherichia coli]BDY83609.1 hypothetical protein MUTS11_19250 [Escherichia coli]
MSIKNDGHYFCRAGGNRPDGLNEPVTDILLLTICAVISCADGWEDIEDFGETHLDFLKQYGDF